MQLVNMDKQHGEEAGMGITYINKPVPVRDKNFQKIYFYP